MTTRRKHTFVSSPEQDLCKSCDTSLFLRITLGRPKVTVGHLFSTAATKKYTEETVVSENESITFTGNFF